MNTDVEFHIRQNYPWNKLPANVKQSLGNSQREYEKHVLLYSIRNQLRFRNNLVRHVRKDERKYYEELLKYSRDHLMLYPYHLSDIMLHYYCIVSKYRGETCFDIAVSESCT
uniref:Family with sequence similarity 91 member A1 n=1 Tax=Mastacembelus armatus TaxID=205130 RepID=A0A7N8YQ37_9TELE